MNRLFFYVLSIAVLFQLSIVPSYAASKAQIFQTLLSGQRSAGVTLSGGKAYFYEVGTSTPKVIYSNRNKSSVAANPYTLDSNGTAQLYGDGLYDIRITDSTGSQKYYWYGVSLVDILSAGVERQNSDFADLNAAIASIGSTPTTLNISTADFPMTGNATVPATLTLKMTYPGSIDQGAYTLTINSPFTAGSYQVFTGSGTVTGLKEATPEWWGTDAAAIQSAVNSGASTINYRPTTYTIDADITLASNQKHIGVVGTVFDGVDKLQSIYIPDGGENIEISGIKFTRLNRTISHTATAELNIIENIRIRNNIFEDCNQGVYLVWTANKIYIQDNTFKDITYAGSTSAIQIGKAEDEPLQGEYVISGNIIDTVTNTTLVASDTHGIIARGYSVFITNNSIKEVSMGATTGTGCEGVYIVTFFSKVIGNSFYNAGNLEASLVLKGSRPPGATVQGSYGYKNIVSNNSFYSDDALSSGMWIGAEDTLVTGNVFEGFGDAGIKITADSKGAIITNNLFSNLTSNVGITVGSSSVNITNNTLNNFLDSSGTTYGIYVTTGADDISDVFIKGNSISVNDNLTATGFEGITFNVATGKTISGVYCDNIIVSDNSTATVRGVNFIGATGSATSDIYVGGFFRGTFSDVVRYNNASVKPTNAVINVDTIERVKNLSSNTTILRWESGKTITNASASGTITATLPISEVNLVYTFIRNATQAFRIDPNGTEIIRGGGAGKYLSLNSDGAFVTLKCVSAGTWEIISSGGTIAYEP